MTSFYNLLKYAQTGIAAPDMSYYDKMRASTLMGGAVQTLTGQPPLNFNSNGTPLISWSMKGNGSQTGTPTPDNPVMPTFCGVRTVNVCPSAAAETKTNNGITAVSNGSGTYHVSGTATADADIRFNVKSFWIPQSIGNYHDGTFSMFNSAIYDNTAVKLAFYYQGTKLDDWGLTTLNRTSTTYSNMSEQYCDAIGFTVKSGVTVDFTISPEFTNDGVLPTEFEPFGWAEKITCAGQTTTVYLGQVSTVRKIRKLVLTGEERWSENTSGTNTFRGMAPLSEANINFTSGYCSHLVYDASGLSQDKELAGCNNGNLFLRLSRSIADTIHDFKSYLAAQYANGTPVTVWYVLATPTTGIVNEPLCKIGDYSDELHSTDAGVSIPTVKGSNTLTVETELQPSEMTITGRIQENV